ncbi:hypothetical protein CAEBREN_07933 [Caenorhabditis brenneri]|uniref:SPK domain-containing protein n=1 Tax=Caenorhabditis brenneri TaxID=135651 RepID=G0NFS8_CAEBE|nr:hypothetical protein CAEBREN_07933 [Caenorhabditis brenneri]
MVSKRYNRGIIDRIRSKILYLEDIDWKTRLKVLFVLSVPVDKESIQSKIKGTFRFDEKRRITYYKSINGVLVLKGGHTPSRKEGVVCFRKSIVDYFANRGKPSNGKLSIRNVVKQETEKFVDLIFEKCKNISSPLFRLQLFAEFDALNGLKMSPEAFNQRIRVYCEVIPNLKSLDTHTKVRQLFGLGANLTEDFLGKLRQNARVNVDNRNRIIEYTSRDGSLYLEGKQDAMSKHHQTAIAKSRRRSIPTGSDDVEFEGDFEEEELSKYSDNKIDSDDDDHQMLRDDNEETEVPDKNKKLPQQKQRRPDDADFTDDSGTPVFQFTSSPRTASRPLKITGSKRTYFIANINTPLQTSNKRKTEESSTDTHKRARKSNNAESNVPFSDEFRTDGLEDYDPNPSSVHSSSMINDEGNGEVRDGEHQNQDVRQNNVNNDYEEVQVGPRTIDASNVRKTSENLRPVVPMTQIPEELVQVKEEVMTEEEDVKPVLSLNRAPILQILQGLHTLIVSLYHPSLETLQKELEERMKRFEGLDTSIPIVQVVWTMELCFSKMTESSVRLSSEGPQFINLRDFLCYLKSFILNLKIEELKSVMDKINESMKTCQNKRVRVKKVEEILRVTLDNITI